MDAKRRYWHPEIGFNYRMTNIQAALGCAQLERFNSMIKKRQQLIDSYRNALSALPVTINPSKEWAKPAPWLTTMLLPKGCKADELSVKLRENGIDSRPFFVPLDRMPPYRKFKAFNKNGGSGCPVAYDLYRRGIILPTIASAQNNRLLNLVYGAVAKYINKK